MIKKLVCFDNESIRNIELLQALFKMNRSQLIRYLLREKMNGIAKTQFSPEQTRINQENIEDIPVEVSEK